MRARRLLGVGPSATEHELRLAYRQLLFRTHPDLSAAGDATERTVELTRAYRLLLDAPHDPPTDPLPDPARTSGATPPPPPPTPPLHEPPAIVLLDDDTIGIAAPPSETLLVLLEAANRLGDISYLDPSAGLVEVVVEFVEAPTSSVLLSLQGRATGVTEVFCTVEPLSGGEAPPSDAVTRLLLHTLREVVGLPE